jgi:hypothetical protein
MQIRSLVACALLLVLVGCGAQSTPQTEPGPRVRVPPPAETDANPAAGAVVPPADVDQTPPTVDRTQPAAGTVAVEPTRKPAQVGVGRKSQQIQGGGYLPTVVRARYRAEERINLNNATYALKLYKAQHGRGPKTHDEYMKEIIKANNIQLPELPDGERYVYDPKSEQLMVEQIGNP